jgi:hypothetical protein
MEEAVDPQVTTETTAEVERPSSPLSSAVVHLPADQDIQQPTFQTVRSKAIDDTQTDKRELLQVNRDTPDPTRQHQLQQLEVLDEERITSTFIDMSINPTDVLSGRGKISFNHGT